LVCREDEKELKEGLTVNAENDKYECEWVGQANLECCKSEIWAPTTTEQNIEMQQYEYGQVWA
jgi:hypothetical protein